VLVLSSEQKDAGSLMPKALLFFGFVLHLKKKKKKKETNSSPRDATSATDTPAQISKETTNTFMSVAGCADCFTWKASFQIRVSF